MTPVVLALALLGADPDPVVVNARHPSFVIEIRAAPGASVAAPRVDGEDWPGFVLDGATLPRQVPDEGVLVVQGRADRRHFRTHDESGRDTWRSGGASLQLEVDGEPVRVGLRFDPPRSPVGSWVPPLVALLLFGATWLRARARSVSPVAVAAAVAAVCLLPFAEAVCFEGGTGPLARAQCAAGRGGIAGAVVHVPGSALLFFALAALADALGPGARRSSRLMAWIAAGLVAGSAMLGAKAGSFVDVVGSSSGAHPVLAGAPAIGLLVQPVGAATMIGALALLRREEGADAWFVPTWLMALGASVLVFGGPALAAGLRSTALSVGGGVVILAAGAFAAWFAAGKLAPRLSSEGWAVGRKLIALAWLDLVMATLLR